MWARSVVADFFTLQDLTRKTFSSELGNSVSDSKWLSVTPLQAQKKACHDAGVGTLILTTSDVRVWGGCGLRSRLWGYNQNRGFSLFRCWRGRIAKRPLPFLARDLSRTPALNKVSSTTSHAGPQDKSELSVQNAVRTSGHCEQHRVYWFVGEFKSLLYCS